MAIIERICVNVISSLYQYASTAFVISFFFMYAYEKIRNIGLKKTIFEFVQNFKKHKEWRRTFALMFCVSMILLRTVFCRKIWGNPLSDIFGNWSFKYADGTLNTELLENILLFIPFSFFMLLRFGTRNMKLQSCLFYSLKYSMFFSSAIEISQIFFRVGTFQISDLLTNTFGGILGGILYYFTRRILTKR